MNDQPKTVSPAPQVVPIGSPEETGLSPAGLAKLTAIMQREIDARRLPGVSMMIARGSKVGYRRDLGVLRPGGPIMPGDAIFRIYSMTKPIVSVALMMLVEDGRLFIADPVAKYLPEFADPRVGVEKDGKLELVAAKRPCSAATARRGCSAIFPTPSLSLKSLSCRSSSSRASPGITAIPPTSSAASSRSYRARPWAHFCASAFSRRSAWAI